MYVCMYVCTLVLRLYMIITRLYHDSQMNERGWYGHTKIGNSQIEREEKVATKAKDMKETSRFEQLSEFCVHT